MAPTNTDNVFTQILTPPPTTKVIGTAKIIQLVVYLILIHNNRLNLRGVSYKSVRSSKVINKIIIKYISYI